MSSEFIGLLAAFGGVAAFIVSMLPVSYNKDQQGNKKINGLGITMFIVAAFLLFIAIGGYHTSNKEKKESKRILDSTTNARDSIAEIKRKNDSASLIGAVNKALEPHNQEFNPKTGEVTEINPLIVLAFKEQTNPFTVLSGDTLLYKLLITNTKDAIAKNFHTAFAAIIVKNGRFEFQGNTANLANELVTLQKGATAQVTKPFYSYKEDGLDTVYFYTKISYTNESGKPQEPFRLVNLITRDLVGKDLILPKQDEYLKVKNILTRRGYW